MRFVVSADVDAAVPAAMRDADAVEVGRISGGSSAAVAAGEAAIAIDICTAGAGLGAATMSGVAAITPTSGVIDARRGSVCSASVSAVDLQLAGRAVAVAAAAAPLRRWPADVRFAAPQAPAVAIPESLPQLDRRRGAAFDSVVERLTAAGCRVVAVDTVDIAALLAPPGPRTPFDVAQARDRVLAGADALVVPAGPGDPDLCMMSDMCAVTVGDPATRVLARAFDDAVALDIAALAGGAARPETVWPLAVADHAELVVFGAHLLGGPLVHQLTGRGARFAGEITTAPRYRMVALPTSPPKPGVTRVPDSGDGAALTGHRWLLSPAALGRFLAELPAPMQLGKVEFADGSWRTAFGCDGSVQGVDVSSYGSWTNALAAGAVRQT